MKLIRFTLFAILLAAVCAGQCQYGVHPAGVFTTIGGGCNNISADPPAWFTLDTSPKIGATIQWEVVGPPNLGGLLGQGIVIVGGATTPPIPVPGTTNCFSFVRPDYTQSFPVVMAPGCQQALFTQIPLDPVLIGLALYAQLHLEVSWQFSSVQVILWQILP